jgi:hypothetical protein
VETTDPPATDPVVESALRRRDSRPGDVKAQADYFSGGPPPVGQNCQFDTDPPTTGPAVKVGPTMELGEATTICLYNFTSGTTVRVEIRRPDGQAGVDQVPFSEPVGDEIPPNTVFATMAGDPVGTYTVTATQGSLQATAAFTVGYATLTNLVVAESPGRGVPSSPRGTPIRIGLAGWAPGQAIDLLLYHSASPDPSEGAGVAPTFITLVPVVMDAHGQRLHVLQTRTDDPTGCYVVNSRPPPGQLGALGRLGQSIVVFCLT